MGYRHTRTDLLDAAVAVALRDGVAALTYASVGKQAATSDRTVVYYFPHKADLIVAVMSSLGATLQELLGEAFGDEPLPPEALLRRAWPTLATPAADPVFAVFFQAIGLATAGARPYAELAGPLLEGWIDWLAPRIDAGSAAARRRAAAAIVAQLDGLLLVRSMAGATTANAAARELGVLG